MSACPDAETNNTDTAAEHFITPIVSHVIGYDQSHSYLCACGDIGQPFHYAMTCYLTTSYHFTKPSENPTSIWWRNLLNNKLSRLKIVNLVSFLLKTRTHNTK
ncbi:hypothetical protein AVEN_38375-1 [Araneus ventricosus]|uniref:Uncharacterized protein n=1 Tax=Araneus ventricosus TaxID=182803 RepID=A0A4Y2M9M9_ARAVE|nr:hypothetical protein AVEN_38375-1 [Araneus ventricosus]